LIRLYTQITYWMNPFHQMASIKPFQSASMIAFI